MTLNYLFHLQEVIQVKDSKQMPVSGKQEYGTAKGQEASTSSIRYGDDMRNGGGKKK